jgi:murein DD-endopeptidase MepM/ murein hydrolase activator NlpD/F0F1-type ATP synthase assembly protein I
MAVIDSKKLLPAGKPGGTIVDSQKPFLVPVSNILYKKDVNISQKLLKPADKEIQGPGGSLVVIKKKVLKIRDVISSTYLIQQSEDKRKRKEKERQKAEEREKKLESKPKPKANLSNFSKISLPGVSILDTIKRFLFFTFVGFLVDKYYKLLPKLLEFKKFIMPVAKFIDSFGKNLVDGVIKFIDLGYQAYDNISKTIKQIGGEDAEKTFHEFSGHLNTLLNGAIAAAMLIASTSPKGVSGAVGAGTAGVSGALARPKPTSGFGAGTAMTPGRYRSPGQSRAGGDFFTAKARKTATQTSLKQTSKQLASQGAKQSLKSLVGVPVIGSLIGFIIDTVVFREKPTRAAAGAVGSALGQGIGIALAGGTTFGLGAGVGMFIGGFVGDIVGKSLYDALTGHQPEPTPAKAQGGQVKSNQSSVAPTRRIRTQRTSTRKTYIPQKTQPGKDVGGKLKIEGLYGKDESGQRSALRALTKSSADLKKMRALNGVAGSMFGAGIDMALGQKPDKKLATSLGNTFGSVIQAAVDAEMNSSFNDISRTIAMANGGVVPSREIGAGMSIGEKIGKYISSAFSIALESSAAKVLQNLNQEFNLEGGPADAGPDGGGAGGYASGEKNFVSSQEIYSYLKSKGLSHNHIMGMLANIQAESSFNAGAIGDNGTSGGLFQHHAERFEGMVAFAGKDWAKNWKRQVDYALREDAGKQYTQKQFKNPEEASAWFTLNFERPANKEQKARDRLQNLQNFAADGSWKGMGKVSSKPTAGSLSTVLPKGRPQFTSGFGSRFGRQHRGIDIGVDANSPVTALEDGEVIDIYKNYGGHGDGIVVKHSNGTKIVYGHVNSNVGIGAKIKKGQIIANVKGWFNAYGNKDNTHLHLERHVDGAAQDPTGYLNSIFQQRQKVQKQRASVAPVQKSREIASLQTDTSYTVIHDVNNIVMPIMVG